jgi:hypothetical protein
MNVSPSATVVAIPPTNVTESPTRRAVPRFILSLITPTATRWSSTNRLGSVYVQKHHECPGVVNVIGKRNSVCEIQLLQGYNIRKAPVVHLSCVYAPLSTYARTINGSGAAGKTTSMKVVQHRAHSGIVDLIVVVIVYVQNNQIK